ncbi:MAG: hypothetical protein KBC96_06435 [Armatimonadetes bacterium]|nr:hypothetical protein [Armatimonadota bacterium]
MRKAAIGILLIALITALAVSAQAAVELYEVKASQYVPAFIDYKLNCVADVTIQILPSDAGGTPTGAAVRTVTFTGQAKGFHRYIWLADRDIPGDAPQGYYVAEVSASANQAQWEPIVGVFTNQEPFTEHGWNPLPTVGDVEGFYDIAMNTNVNSPYYGRIYATHKIQKDIFMYGPDGQYLGKFDDSTVTWQGSAPWNVVVAGDDYVYVSDRSSMDIYCFTPTGTLVSQTTGTNYRGMFARTMGDGTTWLYFTGSASGTYRKSVSANHQTYSGMTLCYNTGGGDGWDAYGLWVSPSTKTSYAACLQGPNSGLTKWVDDDVNGTYIKDNWVSNVSRATDVELVDAATDFLWVTRMDQNALADATTTTNYDESTPAVYKVDPTTAQSDGVARKIITWGHLATADRVGNLVSTFGKSTSSWAQYYWAVFADAGASTAGPKRTTAFYLGATPAPVVVPGTAVWTADNTIAADDFDTASVSFKVMDVNGWADITSCTLDLRPIGYAQNTACTLSQDLSDPTGKTAIATKTGIKAKVGTRCTTSFGQPVHYLTATPVDAAMGSNADPEEVKLQVTGDPYFDSYIRHSLITSWYISGAQIKAVGGGIPGATDPRAVGPFTYYSAPSDTSGYAQIDLSAGSFAVTAEKLGFGSTAAVNISVPYMGYTTDLYLRPLTIAEARATMNGTKVNVQGVCFAQPVGVAPTAANGLANRTDTLVQRSQWYVCDANSPANGLVFMKSAMTDPFPFSWDDVDAQDFLGNSLYIGKRPAVGETIMITGILDAPGGHERRVMIQNADIESGMAAVPIAVDRTYWNRGNLGGLPGTPASKTIAQIYHPMTTSAKDEWGQFVEITGATVVGIHADGLPNPNPQDPAYTFPPYFTVANAAGDSCEVVLETPTSLAATTWTSTVTLGKTFTVKGAGGRRTRYGNGCIRIRSLADLTQTAAAPAAPGPLGVVRTANDGAAVNVSGIVTAKIGSSLWIEAADRSIGIRVKSNPAYVAVGDNLQVLGTLGTENGERVITPTAVLIPLSSGNTIAAFDIRSREIGGAASGTTPGVITGRGALNVGLKVHFLGMVTGIDPAATPAWYYLWDGANRSDMPVSDSNAQGFIGVRVEAAPPAGVAPWTDWVEVTGVVRASTSITTGAVPTLAPITAAKVTTFNTVTAASGTALTAGWNLVGLPTAPAAVSDGDEWSAKAWEPYMVLSPTQDPFDIDGRMYRWENCSGSLYNWDYWTEVGSHGPFGGALLGDGYWMQLDGPWAVSYSGKASTLDQWIGVCNTGWMIIGHPKAHNTYMADLKVHDGGAVYSMTDAVLTNSWIDCVGYWWDNQVQSLIDVGIPDCWGSTDTLLPWHGYWLQAYEKDLALIVPEAPAAP